MLVRCVRTFVIPFILATAACGGMPASDSRAGGADTTATTLASAAPPGAGPLGAPMSPGFASPGFGSPGFASPGLASPGDATAGPAASPVPALPLPADPKERTLALQVALDRAHFSPGEIDGVEGSSHERAMQAFARARNVAPTPEAVWAALAEGEPALVDHTLTAEDVAGPFVKIPQDMMAKAKLEKLGYTSAVEALGERFHASPALLKRLNPGKTFAAGETIRVPNVHQAAPTGRATRVVVDKSDSSVVAYGDGDTVLASYPATMGSENDPLPLGEWKVTGVSREPTFNYNPDLFWDSKAEHSKAKIPPGPNNPVGVVWIDLSKEHYGIHGSPEPAKIGKTESHGCIRLANWDARELADLVAPGVPAILQE